MESTLEEFILKDGDVFMVEMKFGDVWPRDTPESAENQKNIRNFRDFEVGDKIDVYDEKECKWNVGRVMKTFKDTVKIHIE